MSGIIIAILGIIIGAIVLALGLYFLVKERKDPESRKIYSVFAIIGAVIVLISVLTLIF